METLFRLGNRELQDLLDAEEEIPESLIRAFDDEGIDLDEESTLVLVETPGREWRLLDDSGIGVRSYTLKREAATAPALKKRGKRGHPDEPPPDGLAVLSPTESGLSPNLWDYGIFAGVWSEEEGEAPLLIHGLERPTLEDERQRRKWDYFFRPVEELIGLEQEIDVWDAEDLIEDERAEARRHTLVATVWLVAAVVAGVVAVNAPPVGIAAVLAIVVAGRSFFRGSQSRQEINSHEEWKRGLEAEIAVLRQQVPKDIPSDHQIDEWLHEELREIEQVAISELNIPDNMLELADDISPKGFKSILIDDWALIQPPGTHGHALVDPNHLNAIPAIGIDQRPRFVVRYIQYVFPTEEQIAVYGFYYDSILREMKGLATDEYFYRNVVSVGTQTMQTPSFGAEGKVDETTVFSLTVSSGDSIEVALTDTVLMKSLNERLKIWHREYENAERRRVAEAEKRRAAQKKPGERRSRASELFAEPAALPMVSVPEAILPATRARAAIKWIRQELRDRA